MVRLYRALVRVGRSQVKVASANQEVTKEGVSVNHHAFFIACYQVGGQAGSGL